MIQPQSSLRAGIEKLAGIRFLRFLVVGGFNTVVGYALFCIALAIFPTTFIALCVSTLLAILFNFFTTGTLVFGSRDPRRIFRFYGVYGIVFVYNAVGLDILERIAIAPQIGGLVLLPGAVILSYLLNRQLVFSDR